MGQDDKHQDDGCKPDNPAEQPKPPGDDCKPPTPDTKVPELKPPPDCPKVEPPCCCPKEPATGPNCLDDLITAQTNSIAGAERAKQFKEDLEKLLGKAKAAKQEYTPDKHKKLLDEWRKQDLQIADLIRKLVCTVPCWRCVLECYVCKLLNKIRDAEQRLWGGRPYTDIAEVANLTEMKVWRDWDLKAKEIRLGRINKVLAAWEKPSATIEKVLNDNAKLIDSAWKSLGPDAPKLVYDVFMKLVPMHLAIAPPATIETTSIDEKYTDFCNCDEGKPDACCGPDVGEWSLRDRLIGPQPYLIDPNQYFDVVCCLAKARLGPAQDAAIAAKAALQKVEDEIKRDQALVDGLTTTFEKDARAAIPANTTCKCGEDSNEIELPKAPKPQAN